MSDATSAVAFMLTREDTRPVAWTQEELVLETSDATDTKRIEEQVAESLNCVLGGLNYMPPCEVIERW